MELTATDANTGKVLLSQRGALSREGFRRTVAEAFPDVAVKVMIDGVPEGEESKVPASKGVVWKGSFCFPPDAKVTTYKGIKRIGEVVVGEMVLTHRGRFRKVLAKSKRAWHGDMAVLRFGSEDLVVSPGHKVLGSRSVPLPGRGPRALKAGTLAEGDFLFAPGNPDAPKNWFYWISSVGSISYKGQVFDLEVKGDHSYVVNGIGVRNSDMGGYSNMNREICFRLAKRGIPVKIDPLNTPHQVDPETMKALAQLKATKLKDEWLCPMVVGFTPMPVQRPGGRTVFYTMMETRRLHPEFVARCNRYASEVWVPCKFYQDAFKESGVSKPIFLMPLGVDEKLYRPDAPEPHARYEEMPSGKIVEKLPNLFRFLSIFGWSKRKGTDLLCRSFLRAFPKGDACLLICSRYYGGSSEANKEVVRKEIRSYYKEVGDKGPPIYYCGDAFEIQDLPGVYAAADCFVFCSRGEGFGLTPCEAGACGIPIISAYNTSMGQYLDDDVAFLVRQEGWEVADSSFTWITEFYKGQEFAKMGEKSIAQFSEHMQTVFKDRKLAGQKAEKFRERVLKDYTWNKCVDRVAARLGAL